MLLLGVAVVVLTLPAAVVVLLLGVAVVVRQILVVGFDVLQRFRLILQRQLLLVQQDLKRVRLINTIETLVITHAAVSYM